MAHKTSRKNTHVWYAGYGSNLFPERFNCYILGGQFKWGGKPANRCANPTLPKESRTIIIPYNLYFARQSPGWGNGGVAFISTEKDNNEETYCRMWKVTEEQFSHIWNEEGKSWYDKKIDLGYDENGFPICTITSSFVSPSSKPSDNYVKTIVAGLKDSYQLSDKAISQYLINKDGINGNSTEKDLVVICQSIQS